MKKKFFLTGKTIFLIISIFLLANSLFAVMPPEMKKVLEVPLKSYRFNTNTLDDIKISYNNRYIAVKEKIGNYSAVIKIYEADTGTVLATINKDCLSFDFSFDAKYLAGVSATRLFVYSLETKSMILEDHAVDMALKRSLAWDMGKIILSSYITEQKHIAAYDVNGNEIWNRSLNLKLGSANIVDLTSSNISGDLISMTSNSALSMFLFINPEDGDIFKQMAVKKKTEDFIKFKSEIYGNPFLSMSYRWDSDTKKEIPENCYFYFNDWKFLIVNKSLIDASDFSRVSLPGKIFTTGEFNRLYSFNKTTGN